MKQDQPKHFADIDSAEGIDGMVTDYDAVYALATARRHVAAEQGAELTRFIVLGRFDFTADGLCWRLSRAHFTDAFRMAAPRVMSEEAFLALRARYGGAALPLGGDGPPALRPPQMRCAGCGEGWTFPACDDYRVEIDDDEHLVRLADFDDMTIAVARSHINAGRTDYALDLLPYLPPRQIQIPQDFRLRRYHTLPAQVVRYYHPRCGDTAVHELAALPHDPIGNAYPERPT